MPLGRLPGDGDEKYAGVELSFSYDLPTSVAQCIRPGLFDFVVRINRDNASCLVRVARVVSSTRVALHWHDMGARCVELSKLVGLLQVLPLSHPRYRRPSVARRRPKGITPPPFARSDLHLPSARWAAQVVGRLSPWLRLDSPCAALRLDSAAALQQELAW